MVPIVSFWFPFQVVRDVHRASARSHTAPPHLGVWWGLWITILVLNRISQAVEDEAFTGTAGTESATVLAWVVFALTAGAAGAWGVTVHGITRLQHDWTRGVAPTG